MNSEPTAALFPSARRPSFSEDNGPAPANHHLTITVVLKLQNIEGLEKKLKEVTDQDNPGYRRYATMEEVNRMTNAPNEHMKKVVEWLQSQGLHELIARSNDVQFSATVEEAERLFKAHLHKFGIPGDGDGTFIVRHVGGLTIPKEISEFVDFVIGI